MPKIQAESPAYLIELLHTDGTVSHCDVTAHLRNALTAASVHLMSYPDEAFEPEVSLSTAGELEGIGFFDSLRRGRAFITAYYLDRDMVEHELELSGQLAELPLNQLQGRLAELWGPAKTRC